MKKSVLCIEKSKSICFVIETMLKGKYTVLTFDNNYMAMERISSEKSIDLIILSVENLQDENVELLYHLGSSSLLHDIPVIILSSSRYEEIEPICLESNVHAFFTKPFNPLELSEKINQTILTTGESQILYEKRKIFNLN
ncbi:MAG: response regulator [Ginsengibacter sp.]